MINLNTRWGKEINKDNIHQEYPRPQLMRDSYFNLNGEWDYEINKSGRHAEYRGKILVPFAPEAPLSGVKKVVRPDEFLHYKKCFSLPEGFCRDRVILHFGAVDQECRVFLNGVEIGAHKGGYLPFSFDVSEQIITAENVLTLCVTDKTEQSPHARGKQKLVKKGKYGSLFYTPTSGIWKTVWLESVPEDYITGIRITPDFDKSLVHIQVSAAGSGELVYLRVLDHQSLVQEAEFKVNTEVTLPLEGFHPWTPDSPYLYDVEAEYGKDKVKSYFGMRKFSVERDHQHLLNFCLNNKPFFFNGVLDQGYWPDGLLTAPSDEALVYDIAKMKELGYNTIRKHVKIEPERFYYHCDRLGMVVWQDMPNGGGDYNMMFVTYLPNLIKSFGRKIKDSRYSSFKRQDQEGREQYYRDLEGMIRLLYNYPSIAVWIPFNEGWGQFDSAKATRRIRSIDNTRLINEASGWFDQQGGDIFSIHKYLGRLKITPQTDRVVALTEFGGYAYPVEGHVASKKQFGYQHYNSKEELTQNYKRLIEQDIYPNIKKGLCSAIYTQISDVEEEINGLMTYDREIDKIQVDIVREVNEKLYRIFNQIKCIH